MKRLILIAAFILTAGTLAAQNYIIVNSEKVFKSIDAYNTAISDLDKLAKQYQDQVDAKFVSTVLSVKAQMEKYILIKHYLGILKAGIAEVEQKVVPIKWDILVLKSARMTSQVPLT